MNISRDYRNPWPSLRYNWLNQRLQLIISVLCVSKYCHGGGFAPFSINYSCKDCFTFIFRFGRLLEMFVTHGFASIHQRTQYHCILKCSDLDNSWRLRSVICLPLHWRHNDHVGVSNHQPRGCLLNRLFRRRWKKTSKLRVTGLCAGNSPGPVNSPHKGPVTRKMFPFDDVIMLV